MTLNSDRRKNRRLPFEAIILHDILLPDIFYKAKMYNISKGGVYFESDQVLYPGEEVYIGLKSAPYAGNRDKNYSCVKIKWRKDLQDSSFQYGYGAAFINISASLMKIIDVAGFGIEIRPDHKLKKEKDPRNHQRQSYRKAVYFTSRNITYKGFIKNISRGGAFIITSDKFAIGQMIKLFFPGTKIKKKAKLKGWIVRVDQNGVGVKFDRRSGKDRRSDLDRRRKILDRRKTQIYRKKRVSKR